MPNTQLRGNIGDAGMQIKPSKDVKSVYKLLQQKQSKLNDQDLLLTKDYISVAKDIGIKTLDSKKDIRRAARSIHQSEEATDQPQNLVIFIRDQVKPEDLWLPRNWAKENLPTRQWLLDNGLSFENSFTNTAMCSSARATFFTGKYPAQHELDLLLSDIENPILDSEVQLNPDLPTLGTVLGDLGYDVSFFGKTHLSKTFTTVDDEVVYQDMTEYDFEGWQGPDAGQDMDPKNAGGGYADNDTRFISEATSWLDNRINSGNTKPFAMVVSLVNPHDVLSYPLSWGEGDPETYFGYSEDIIEGDINILPPTVDEPIRGSMSANGYDFSGNYKPQIQREWLLAQAGGQPLPTDELKLNYLNFYGNLMKIADSQMGEVINTLAKQGEVNNTMFVSTADHGEMGMSHGGMVQKMFNAYEESIRVPMIWSNPRYFKGGQKSKALVSLVDFLPTVANFYGSSEDQINNYQLSGVDYSSILKRASRRSKLDHEAKDVQSSVLYTYDDIYAGQDPRNSIPQGAWDHGLLPGPNRLQAVRTKDFKYARYYSEDKTYEPKNWQGELYDLRPGGGDYYPNIDPITGQLNPFKAAPLELKNLDPKAEALRVLQGEEPIATRRQKRAYKQMSNLLDSEINEKLQPLLPQESKEPTFFRYRGGSSQNSAYDLGDPIIRLIPATNGSQNLEVAFNTRAGQSYNIVSIEQALNNGAVTIQDTGTLLSNIVGTNGPTYHYLTGLSGDLSLANFAIEWIGGYVPLETIG
ncbi:sulfatase-like hydrolase/transferase [Synechococcus sp. LA31]|uniref:sulfatase-like hydrolase/transferase n=1 Tax=Synechococcus sp. LA31 TaxID=2741953 RepID=UPI001BDD76A7|nr:sulfatase-like hydrolase/transferase [Synechococcus sp. LA31]QVV68527.1 sulfatase-like hydrolase/transferase [Synechococcus sp. LA31]